MNFKSVENLFKQIRFILEICEINYEIDFKHKGNTYVLFFKIITTVNLPQALNKLVFL